MKQLSLLLALVGLAVSAVLVAWFDAGQVLQAALSVGWRGFLLLALWQAGLASQVRLDRPTRPDGLAGLECLTWSRCPAGLDIAAGLAQPGGMA